MYDLGKRLAKKYTDYKFYITTSKSEAITPRSPNSAQIGNQMSAEWNLHLKQAATQEVRPQTKLQTFINSAII